MHLQSGEGLKAADDNGLSDPYVKFVLGQKCVSSKMVRKTLDPVWNEELAFKNLTLGEVLREPMVLGHYDWDFMKSDDALGVGDLRALIGSLEGGVEATVKLDDGQGHRARCG